VPSEPAPPPAAPPMPPADLNGGFAALPAPPPPPATMRRPEVRRSSPASATEAINVAGRRGIAEREAVGPVCAAVRAADPAPR
jgi:hypothetical protein